MTITDLSSADIAPAPSEPSTLRFDGIPLPRGLREDADTMSWSTFTATYAPSAGPLRLGHWECADTERPATRLGPRTFRATLGFGDHLETATATATGPVAALTAMLYDHGIAVRCCGSISCGQRTRPRPSFRAATAAGPSGRWAVRTTRPSRHCTPSSPAPTGCTEKAAPAKAGATRSACRPSGSACRRSPISPGSPRGVTQAGSVAAAGAGSS